MTDKESHKRYKSKKIMKTGGGSGIWFAGFIGALVYYLHFHSGTFWLVIVAVFKSLFWPAFLVYHLLQFLHM